MNNFYKHIFRSSCLQMFFKISALKNFATLRIKKRLQHRCFCVRSSHISQDIDRFFHRTLITSYFRPVNIVTFLRKAFSQNTSRSSRLLMFFKIDTLKSFGNFTGKHLSWSLFLKNLQAEGLQLYQKKPLQHRCFSVKFAKFLGTHFLQNPSGFFTSGGCFCIFLKK